MMIFAVAVWKLAAFVYPLVVAQVAVFVMRPDRVPAVEADAGKRAFLDAVSIAARLWVQDFPLSFHRHP
jgi:hypothetical protein